MATPGGERYALSVSDLAVTPFFFTPAELQPIAESRRDAFAAAKPFPHVVLDRLLPDEVLEQVLAEFPEPSDESWFRFDHGKAHKSGMNEDWRFGPSTRQLLSQFNSAVFVKFLESLTGIEGLIPDPHFRRRRSAPDRARGISEGPCRLQLPRIVAIGSPSQCFGLPEPRLG